MLKIMLGIFIALLLGYLLIHFLQNFERTMVGKEDRKAYETNKTIISPSSTPNAKY